ncbi:MAG: RDD family protein [Bryobacteraceae bacterium]|nr:RDD family protein [Bryobacteraceae bacterium]
MPGQLPLDFTPIPASRSFDAAKERFRVAGLGRRSIACVVDLAMALALGVLPFLIVVRGLLAASWVADSRMHATIAAVSWFILGLYHLLFAVAGVPSVGQRFARLRLVTMEGRPSEPPQRVWRVLFYSLFPPACLLGSVWVLLTEERYSWADQVSRTYFTTAEAR